MAIPDVPAAQPGSSKASRDKVFLPPKGRYQIKELLKAPGRLIHPGRHIEEELEKLEQHSLRAHGEKFDQFKGVRGMQRVKLCDVTLDDVIAGKHTPPLTLRDFEDFLAFREKSAENLYFHIWLDEYRKLYEQSRPSDRPHEDVITLGKSFKTAVDTFFAQASPLEVNVPSDIRREIDGRIRDVSQATAAAPSNEAFLPPDAFERVHDVTSESLAISFKAFRKQVVRNADRNRGWFAIFLGVLTWALGLIPTIVCAVLDKARGWRAFGIPLWWFGTVVAVGGLGKTCLVIYLFGDNRQLYPWERQEYNDIGTLSSASGSTSDPWNAPSTAEDGASSHVTGEKGTPPGTPFVSALPESRRSSQHSPMSDLGYFPLAPASLSISEKSQKSSSASKSGSRRQSTTPGGLYFAPAGMDLPRSSRVWAPFTKMMNPIVARSQRNLVLAAAGYGLIVCAITTAICLSVPNRDRS
ncbi:uncharacterized protein JCM10292_000839 [Rhodotorula paludigena]|uniref:uncharacterized protein n=1 Tax=Rhodotorula paludigena TaxID=86838 RepID=UPI003173BCD8